MVGIPTAFPAQVSLQVAHIRIADAIPVGGHARTAIPDFGRDRFIIYRPPGKQRWALV